MKGVHNGPRIGGAILALPWVLAAHAMYATGVDTKHACISILKNMHSALGKGKVKLTPYFCLFLFHTLRLIPLI